MSSITCPCVLAGDANAEHPVWSNREGNSEGEHFVELLARHRLASANEPSEVPTYQRLRAGNTDEGWIDVTAYRDLSLAGWTLDNETPMIENHRFIRWEIELPGGKSRRVEHGAKRFVCARADWDKFDNELAQRLVEWSECSFENANEKASYMQKSVTDASKGRDPEGKTTTSPKSCLVDA